MDVTGNKFQHQSSTPKTVELQYLRAITKQFSKDQILGNGGFGTVYKGDKEDGEVVAVKKLINMVGMDDKQFLSEVKHLVDVCHPNIVRLEGYCYHIERVLMPYNGSYIFVDEVHRLLCFEYLPNGSLDKHLTDESSGLDWHKRYNIIEGICKGLHYLHEGRRGAPILHLDLKPSNILLDKNMVPKIADFGLSRLFGEEKTHTCTMNLIGSFAYMPPEYIEERMISKESDIFSLGVIIIEIVTGRRKYPDSTTTQEFIEVHEKWRRRLQTTSNNTSLEEDCQQVNQCIEVGLKCMERERKKRPNIREIIEMLNGSENTNSCSVREDGTCAGCKNPIGHGRFRSCMGSVWHPQCFRCFACNKPISDYEFAMHEDQPYHKSCYKEFFHPKCDVCKNFIPTNKNGLIEYRAHPFWMQKYCPSHEDDGTPRCCSCERMEPMDIKYITLDDGRKLCLECLNSAIMDTPEGQHLYMDIQEFFEGLNMKIEQQVPLLLVERQALNEAMEAEKSGHHLPETRGLSLSEEQIVRSILRRPRIGPGNRIIDMITGPYKLSRRCEVTAILILYGLPRLQTGSILAHEMMHAYLRLKGYRSLSPKVEEGFCQVLSHMWLESEIISGSSGNVMSTSVPSSTSSSTPTSSKKGAKTEFEKKLGAFIKHQIETDPSVPYGDGFRAGNRAVESYGLRNTLDHIQMTGSFPYSSLK